MEKHLSLEAVRVLGVLMEKELSTPTYYPMTQNALVNGCNQKSNRHPVVEYSEFVVRDALDELQVARLCGHASIAGGRSEKFRHAARQQWELERGGLAILCSLMLRGAQTIGELRTHTARMLTFETMDEVASVLNELMERQEPLVMDIGRGAGQKGNRFAQLLAGDCELEQDPDFSIAVAAGSSGLEELRERLTRLENAFEAFRSQFE